MNTWAPFYDNFNIYYHFSSFYPYYTFFIHENVSTLSLCVYIKMNILFRHISFRNSYILRPD